MPNVRDKKGRRGRIRIRLKIKSGGAAHYPQTAKGEKVAHEWKQGSLHIGKSKKTVLRTKKGQKQMVVIMLSIERKAGHSVPPIHRTSY